MEKGRTDEGITNTLQKLHLDLNSNSKCARFADSHLSPGSDFVKKNPPSLVSLCLGVVGMHFEDIIADLGEIAVNFPVEIKMAMAAIARRRKLLNDDVLICLAESSWEVLDISNSDVSDFGLLKVAEMCRSLRAVDISRCSMVTGVGVSELIQRNHSLEVLRCGGCPRSDYTARVCLGVLKPKLNAVEGESWEEIDMTEIVHGAQSLRWLVWPKIDKDSSESLALECPRIIVNPKLPLMGYRGSKVPREALPDVIMDDAVVSGIDPQTWAVGAYMARRAVSVGDLSPGLHIAEKFRLAFEERDARLAPKRAKNARQRQRRAQREWMSSSTIAKASLLASQASVHRRHE